MASCAVNIRKAQEPVDAVHTVVPAPEPDPDPDPAVTMLPSLLKPTEMPLPNPSCS